MFPTHSAPFSPGICKQRVAEWLDRLSLRDPGPLSLRNRPLNEILNLRLLRETPTSGGVNQVPNKMGHVNLIEYGLPKLDQFYCIWKGYHGNLGNYAYLSTK